MSFLFLQPSPLAGEGGMRSMTDEGAVQQAPTFTTLIKHTPHPPFGHLLPQGEKVKRGECIGGVREYR